MTHMDDGHDNELPDIDYVFLSSGRRLAIVEPDFAVLKTERDHVEAAHMFAERSLSIERNIEMSKLGRNMGRRQLDPDWLMRANTALLYSKLNQQTIQSLLNVHRSETKDRKNKDFNERFVEVARCLLPPDELDAIIRIAGLGEKAKAILEIKKKRSAA